jgi:DNA-binding NarL/FixJ family response regulator
VVADDAEALRFVFAAYAALLGHEVVGQAADAESAERLVRTLAPDLIVVDSRLPPLRAPAAVARVRRAAPEAAILIAAALDETALVRESLEAGADGALLRPLSLSGLAEALRGCVRERPGGG